MVKDSDLFQKLIQKAFEAGASDAKFIPAQAVVVEGRFAEMCASPQCPGYGLSPSCPPHVMKPHEFKDLLSHYEQVLVFKIDVPTEVLLSDGRRNVAKLIHEISSGIERLAKEKGYTNSKGFAAGSCKLIFCNEQAECVVLDKNEKCLFFNQARPSLSGLGVNFFELTKIVGWQIKKITKDTKPDEVPMGIMAGMVLIG